MSVSKSISESNPESTSFYAAPHKQQVNRVDEGAHPISPQSQVGGQEKMHYHARENPTELYHERHQLLVGQAKRIRLARKAQIKQARPKRRAR